MGSHVTPHMPAVGSKPESCETEHGPPRDWTGQLPLEAGVGRVGLGTSLAKIPYRDFWCNLKEADIFLKKRSTGICQICRLDSRLSFLLPQVK